MQNSLNYNCKFYNDCRFMFSRIGVNILYTRIDIGIMYYNYT